MRTTNNVGKAVRFLLSFSLAAMLIAILGFVLPLGVSAGSGTWTPTGGPMVNGGQVNAIVVHPTIPNTLFAAVGMPSNGGAAKIYKSTGDPANWTPVYTPTNQTMKTVAVTGTLVYAAGSQNYGEPLIARSTATGTEGTWTAVFTGTTQDAWFNFEAIAINPLTTTISNTIVYAAGEEGGKTGSFNVVYRSGDGGTTWERKLQGGPGITPFRALAINPITPTTVFVAGREGNPTYGVIWRTIDDGANWQRVYTSSDAGDFSSLVIDPNNPNTIYAGTAKGEVSTYFSTDGGDTWSKFNAASASQAGFKLALDPANATIYGVRGIDIYASPSGGGTWTKTAASPGDPIQSIAIDLNVVPRALYAGSQTMGVSKSTTGGASWALRNTGIVSPISPRSIAIDPSNPDKIYTGGGFPGGFVSSDGGAHWGDLPLTAPKPLLNAFAINPSNPSVVVAGGYGSYGTMRIVRSADSGASWTAVYTPAGTDQEIVVLAFDSGNPTNAYAGGTLSLKGAPSQGLVLKSADGGLNWTIAMTKTASSPGFAALAANSGIVLAGGTEDQTSGPSLGVIYRSADGGTSWTRVMTSTQTIRSVVIDRWSPNIVYAADDGNVVYKSINGGNTWTTMWDSTGRGSGTRLVVDPRPSNRVYLAGFGYMGESTDGGATFTQWSDPLISGMPKTDTQSLAVDNGTTTQNLYLGLTGVWKYSRPAPPATYTLDLPLVSK